MQELSVQPQFASPYTPAGGSNTPPNMPAPPRLGTPIPGTTGGLPAKPGLSVFDNPLAQGLQSQAQPQQAAQHAQQFGRGQDSMLVHMTPEEVNSLRGLAQRFGGDLSVNPNTGLPEAGFLGKLLPTLLGGIASIAFPAVAPWMWGLGGAAVGTAATGSLSKGLMMGLGAFGGASLAGGLKTALANTTSNVAGGVAPQAADIAAKTQQLTQPWQQASANLLGNTAAAPSVIAPATGGVSGIATNIARMAPLAPQQVAQYAGQAAAQGAAQTGGGLLSGFGNAAKTGISSPLLQKAAPMAAGLGLLSNVSSALTPKVYKDKKKPSEYGYTGPYRTAEDRFISEGADPVRSPEGVLTTPEGKMTSGERLYYKPTTSYVDSSGKAWTPGEKTTPVTNVGTSSRPKWVYNSELDAYNALSDKEKAKLSGKGGIFFNQRDNPVLRHYATGGELFHMESGGHVFPAKAVAAYGNFDTEAGQEKLAKLGGIPIKGPGDGVSDSIRAKIDGAQDARVATGEVYFPPKAVKKLGGNEKLYAMMRKAEHAANRAKSGEKVKGLGAL